MLCPLNRCKERERDGTKRKDRLNFEVKRSVRIIKFGRERRNEFEWNCSPVQKFARLSSKRNWNASANNDGSLAVEKQFHRLRLFPGKSWPTDFHRWIFISAAPSSITGDTLPWINSLTRKRIWKRICKHSHYFLSMRFRVKENQVRLLFSCCKNITCEMRQFF